MKINLVSVADETMASYRYHVQLPARQLAKRGHDVSISKYPEDGSDVYVFSKHFNYGDRMYVRAVRSLGKRAVFHCCDHHFTDQHEGHYRGMIQECDAVIASTPILAGQIQEVTGRWCSTVPDMYEFPRVDPKYGPGKIMRILWYGHHGNLDSLRDIFPNLRGYDIRICTTPGHGITGVQMLPYSKSNILAAFDWCDAVIIPQTQEVNKVGKSENRLIEAVQNGKFVIASPVPSYQKFSSMYIGDVIEGLEWLKKQDNNEITERIRKAQDYIEAKHSPDVVGEQWEMALT